MSAASRSLSPSAGIAVRGSNGSGSRVSEIPPFVSGPITIAAIVILGTLVFPWLLRRRGGRVLMWLATVFVSAAFAAFQGATPGASDLSVAIAALIGVAPALVALIVARLQRTAQ